MGDMKKRACPLPFAVVFGTLIAWAGVSPAHAETCPEMVGRWGYGTVEAIAADEGHVYAGCGTYLQIYGLLDPARPSLISEVMLAGQVRGITLDRRADRTYAFVAGSRAGLIIVDVTEAAAPAVVGGLDTPYYAYDVVVQGDLAYVADHDNGSWSGNFSALRIADIRDLARPVDIGSISSSLIEGVAVRGRYAYLATFNGLEIVDVGDPHAPIAAGSFEWDAFAENVEIRTGPGGELLAYVCDAVDGLFIIDVTNPFQPSLYGRFDWFGAYDVAFVGPLAYVAAYFDGFTIVDVSDPSDPLWVGYLDTTERVEGVAVPLGQFAYLADGTGLKVADVRDPSWPVETVRYDLGAFWGTVIAEGSLVYITGGHLGIRVLEFSDETNPREIGRFDTRWQAIGLAKSGTTLYIADVYGVSILDVSDPTAPQELSYYKTPCSAMEVAAKGGYVYVACSFGGLRILDVSDPVNPFETGSIGTLDEALGLCTYDHYVLIADWTGGVRVVDVSDPFLPRDVWWTGAYHAHDVAVSGHRAYVADPGGRLVVIDLEYPENPVVLGSIEVPGNPAGVTARGDIAFVAAWDDGWLRAYDTSNPLAIRELGTVETPGYPEDVALSGDILVATDAGAGITFHRVDGCGFGHQRPLGPP